MSIDECFKGVHDHLYDNEHYMDALEAAEAELASLRETARLVLAQGETELAYQREKAIVNADEDRDARHRRLRRAYEANDAAHWVLWKHALAMATSTVESERVAAAGGGTK